MAEYTINFDVETNEDWQDALAFVAGDPATEVDLTDYTFDMHIRVTTDSVYTILSLTTTNGRLMVSDPASDGILHIVVPLAVMRGIAPGSYVHDMRWHKDGVVKTFARGAVKVSDGVTE